MKLKEKFVLRDVCGKKVLMAQGLQSIDDGRVMSLSESAAWLWQEARLQGDFTVDSLAKSLCEEYDITPDDAQRDVDELVTAWQTAGLLV
jgi:hypothetical protein